VSTEKYLTYRGDVRAVTVADGAVAFVTVDPEGRPTAIYRLHPEKLTLSEHALPAGGQALLATAEGLWVGGTDGRVYHLGAKGAAAARGPQLAELVVALAALSGDRLAVASGARVAVLARGDGKQLQELELPEAVTCLAADPTGQWLAAGTTKGTVAVFESETAPEFRPSDSAVLHEAAVTALWFEPDELRFLSAGADQKLLSTHARGRLEAEDRGRGANHDKPVTAIVGAPAGRFLTGSADQSIKSWPPGKAGRPVTLKDGVGKVVALAVVPIHGKPQVVAACEDNTLRFFALDDEGRFGEPASVVHGADDWAKNELAQDDPQRREAALRALADLGDAQAVQRIATQMGRDPDHALRLLACKLLAKSAHPRAVPALEKGLTHRDEPVRLAAFEGLRRHVGPSDLRPMEQALKAGKADIGQKAVEALQELAPRDDQALARLVGALEDNTPEVRRSALAGLEKVHGDDPPAASLAALGSRHADLRRLALVRLFQRKLLHEPRVESALRWRGEDADPEVRRVAFLLSLYTRERLLQALRQRDADLDRQLTELESGTLPAMAAAPAAEAAPPSKPVPRAQPSVPPAALAASVTDILQQMRGAAAQPAQPPDPEALAQRLEEIAQKGLLPAPMIQRVLQMVRAAGPQQAGLLNMLANQVEMLTRMQGLSRRTPVQPEEEDDEDESEES
jgi:ParB family chromosome partitioning protein